MFKGKLSMLIIFSLIVALTGSLGVFIAINMSKASSNDKKKVEFFIEGSSKIYDGTPLKLNLMDVYLVDEESLPEGYSFNITCDDTITNVGIIMPNPSISIYDEDGNNVSNNYAPIIKENGGLKVERREIKVNFDSARKAYDGTPINSTTYNIVEGQVASGQKIQPVFKSQAESINDGEVPIKADIFVIDSNNYDVTDNYIIKDNLDDETGPVFAVSGVVLRISTKSATKEFDGKPLRLENANDCIICSGLNDNDTIKIIDPASITEIGSIENVITEDNIIIFDKDGSNVTNKYQMIIDSNYGELTVTKRRATVTLLDINEVFDNNYHSSEDDEYESETGIVEGHIVGCEYTSEFKDVVKNGKNNATVKVYDENDRDVTESYELTVIPGKVNITEATIKFTFNDDSRYSSDFVITYEGDKRIITIDYKSDRQIEAKDIYTCEDYIFSFSFENEVKLKDVNTYNVKKMLRWKSDSIDDKNYTTEIENIEVIIKNDSDIKIKNLEELSKVYDGNPIVEPIIDSKNPGTKVVKYSTDGFDYVIDRPINAGIYYIKVEIPKTGSFEAVSTIERFKISKATISPDSITAPEYITHLIYNGSDQLLASAGVMNSKYGHIEYQLTDVGSWVEAVPKGKNAGTYTIKYRYVVTDNYYPIDGGSFNTTIGKAEYNYEGIEFSDDTIIYDGKYHSLTISGTLPEGISVSYEGGGIDANLYLITAIFTDEFGNYEEIDDKKASLTISKRKVTIASESLEKVFDGDYLMSATDDEFASPVHYTVTGLPELYSVKVLFDAKIRDVGSTENEFSFDIYDQKGIKVKKANFDLTIYYGSLTVKQADLIVNINDVTASAGQYSSFTEIKNAGLSYSTSCNGKITDNVSITLEIYDGDSVATGSIDSSKTYQIKAIITGSDVDNYNIIMNCGYLRFV